MEYPTWEQIATIPWPFYAMIVFILYSIYRTTKPSIVPVRVLFLIPAFFALITPIYFMSARSSLISMTFGWLPGCALGAIIGILTYKKQQVKAIKGEKKLFLPGSWSTIILLMIITATQGLLKVLTNINPAWHVQSVFDYSWFFIYGFFAGIFIGRTTYALRCLKYGPFITMEEAKVL